MPNKPFTFPRVLQCLVQASEGAPIAFSLDMVKFYTWAILLMLSFATCFVGTLFFFREVEINRKLQDQLIEAQLKSKTDKVATPVIPPVNTETNPPVDEILNSVTVPARLGNLGLECQVERCTATVELLTGGSGISQGELLIVLETEVPRIGTGGHKANIRKQFILYPGFTTKDEWDNSEIHSLEKRRFRFSRALNTSTEFKLPNLLKPLALNVYLFDSNKALIRHERKPIDTDDSYAN